jgi:site-specific recombinase XerC
MCGCAARKGFMVGNPCGPVKLPAERRTHDPWTYLLMPEQDRILSVDIPEADHYLIRFALYSGLREGEQLSLRLPDFHLGDAEIVVRYGGGTDPTKAGKVKTIPLLRSGAEALAEWLRILPRFCSDNPRRLVFPGPLGGMRDVGHPLRRSSWKDGRRSTWDGWEDALAKAGIIPEDRHDGRPVRWHDLRHTCASSLVAGWWGEPWRLEDLRVLLRHSSVKVTEKYAHLAPKAIAGLAARTGAPSPVGATVGAEQARPVLHLVGKMAADRASGDVTHPGPGSSVGTARPATPDAVLHQLATQGAEAARAFRVAVVARDPHTVFRGLDLADRMDALALEIGAVALAEDAASPDAGEAAAR